MKILFVDNTCINGSLCQDYLETLVYDGLCSVLGADNVVDWDYQVQFHEHKLYPWTRLRSVKKWSDEEVRVHFPQFNLVLMGSVRTYAVDQMRKLKKLVPRHRWPTIAILDGEDYTAIRWDVIEEFEAEHYFKTSHVPNPLQVHVGGRPGLLPKHPDTLRKTQIHSCPLTTTFDKPLLNVEKTVDVTLLGGNNWHGPLREGVSEDRPLLKPIVEEALRSAFPSLSIVTGNVEYADYQRTLAAAKISVCVGGHGLEPIRTYESLTSPDTLVIRPKIEHLTPWALNEQNCVIFTDYNQIPELCRRWLDDEPARLQVARRGNDTGWNHYTPEARARYVLEKVR